MEKQFWLNAWKLKLYDNSSFRKTNFLLRKHLPPEVLAGKTVFVPLCGKTLDMLYLRQFAGRVIGVDMIEELLLEFLVENKLEYQRTGQRFSSGNLTLLGQDLFNLPVEEVGRIDLIYDFGALAALPYPMRMQYLRVLNRLALVGTRYFLNTLEYAPELSSEPPFSIGPTEVAAYFPNYQIQHVENSMLPRHPFLHQRNLSFVVMHGFMMQKLTEPDRAV